MGILVTLNWEKVSEQGLPVIGNINSSVLFIHDQAIYEGWPADDDYYLELGEDVPPNDLRDWESVDGEEFCGDVEYWAYIPEGLSKLL